MKKAVLYLRYSSNNQTEQSIEGQRHVCEQYAERNDIEIVGEYADRAISGTTDKRPDFRRMMADAQKGEWELILVYKLDRFARSRYDSLVYKHSLKEMGVRVVSATEPLTDEPMGVIMESLIEGMDEYYSVELAQKMRRGKMESLRKGRYIAGTVPYGYGLDDDRHLILKEPQASVARDIFERYASGERISQITQGLWRARHPEPSGKPVERLQCVSYAQQPGVFRNTAYRNFGDIPCPAVISEDLYKTVRKRLSESRRRFAANIARAFTTCSRADWSAGSAEGHSPPETCKEKYHYYRCKNG